TAQTVAPGTFVFSVSSAIHQITKSPIHQISYSVTWWDPRALHLGAESSFGLRRDDLIVKEGDMFAVEERLAAYEAWRGVRAKVLEQAARPSVRAQTATAWAVDAAKAGIDEAIVRWNEMGLISIPGAAGGRRGP